MVTTPRTFNENVIFKHGSGGRSWLNNLEQIVDDCLQEWSLKLAGAVMCGSCAIVLPVEQAGLPRVLKVSWIDEKTKNEALALTKWRGHGAVLLFEQRASVGALLLERLNEQRSLAMLDIDSATWHAGAVLRRLAIPSPEGLPTHNEVYKGWSERLVEDWNKIGKPFARFVVDAAIEACTQRLEPAVPLLVNVDLHYGNVLEGGREPWLAIDPKVMCGDLELGVAPLLWNRFDFKSAHASLDRKLALLAEVASLDYGRARDWCLVRTVEYWLWSLKLGYTHESHICEAITGWLLRTQ
jgi:streptomycin 6-kinase